MANCIFTIGYAKLSMAQFLKRLKTNGIEVVADVRSLPFSQFKPEFDKDTLTKTLKSAGIQYIFLGKECGARSKVPGCKVNGQVDFELYAMQRVFQTGIRRIVKGSKNYSIALLCAENDPISCHRHVLIGKELKKYNCDIRHIWATGLIENIEDAEVRMSQKLGLQPNQLSLPGFGGNINSIIETAYRLQGKKIAPRN